MCASYCCLFCSVLSIASFHFFSDLDHTADVQLHCWGQTLIQAFENVVPWLVFAFVRSLT